MTDPRAPKDSDGQLPASEGGAALGGMGGRKGNEVFREDG